METKIQTIIIITIPFVVLNQGDHHRRDQTHQLEVLLDGKGELKSDVDPQLLINLGFKQPVKVHSIVIKGPQDNAPKTVKIFANIANTLGFEEAQREKPIQTIEVVDDQPIALKYVLLQKVQNLQLFIENNVGGEGEQQTVVDSLHIYGTPVPEATNMNELKRVAGKTGESTGNHY